jgi:hypothetical protein
MQVAPSSVARREGKSARTHLMLLIDRGVGTMFLDAATGPCRLGRFCFARLSRQAIFVASVGESVDWQKTDR